MTRMAPMALSLACLVLLAACATPAEPLVNLGRLSIAQVYGSGVTSGRPLDDQFYGLPNLFDNGTHSINGTAYPFWSAHGAPHWVHVSFRQPVEIHRIEVEIDPDGIAPTIQVSTEPASFQTTMRARDPFERTLSWGPAEPVSGVRRIRFEFDTPHGIRVDEIRILGTVPPGTDLTEAMPELDAAYGRRLAEELAAEERRRHDMIHANIRSSIAAIRDAGPDRDRDPPGPRTAMAWLESNRAADRLIAELWKLLDSSRRDWLDLTEPFITEARSHGFYVGYCEIGGVWGASNEGYHRYLELLPDGPDADEATWFGPMRNGPRCGEFEGSIEEWETLIRDYRAFLTRYPGSRLAGEARERLADALVGLEEERRIEADRR